MNGEKKWRVKEESITAKQIKINKKISNLRARIQKILENSLIPRELKIKMISDLKAKIKNYELEIGIEENNKELLAFDKLEKVLQDKWLAAKNIEEEQAAAKDLEELETARDQMREEFLNGRHAEYNENLEYRNKLLKIMGHKSARALTMKEIKNFDKATGGKDDPGTQKSDKGYTRNSGSYSPSKSGTNIENNVDNETDSNKPVDKKKFNSKDYWQNLVDIAERNGVACEAWNEKIEEIEQKDELEKAQLKMEQATKKEKEAEKKIIELNEKLEIAEANLEKAKAKVEKTNEGLGKLEKSKKSIESKANNFEEQLNAEKDDAKRLEKKKELEEARKSLEEVSKKIENAKKELEKSKDAEKSANETKSSLEKDLAETQKMKDEAIKEHKQARKELEKVMGIDTEDPAAGTPDPATGTPDPAAGTPEPVAGTPDPVAGTPDPAAGTPDPVAGTPDPAAGTPDPVVGTPAPAPRRKNAKNMDARAKKTVGDAIPRIAGANLDELMKIINYNHITMKDINNTVSVLRECMEKMEENKSKSSNEP